MTILAPVLQATMQDLAWQIQANGTTTIAPAVAESLNFSVLYMGVWYVYLASQKTAAIAGFQSDPNFVGWQSLNGADNARIAWSTSDNAGGTVAFNVKAQPYGAKGDGVTDDAASIQAAIAAAVAAGGAQVFFPPGTYIVGTTLVLPSNVELVGDSRGNCIIKLKNASAASTAILKSTNFDALVGSNGTGGVIKCALRNLIFDGNVANNAHGRGVCIYGYDFQVSNIIVRNCGDNNQLATAVASAALWTEWSTTSTVPGTSDSMEGFFDSIKVHDNSGVGWYDNGPHDSQHSKCLTFLNGGVGLYVGPGQGGGLFMEHHSWGAAQPQAIYCLANGAHFMNCIAEGATDAQVVLAANNCAWIGGAAYTNVAPFSSYGVRIGDGANTPSFIRVNTKIINTQLGAFDYASDGGNCVIAADFYSAAAAPCEHGAPNAGAGVVTVRRIEAYGFATGGIFMQGGQVGDKVSAYGKAPASRSAILGFVTDGSGGAFNLIVPAITGAVYATDSAALKNWLTTLTAIVASIQQQQVNEGHMH